MPENRNDDAGQPGSEPNGFAAPGQPSPETTPNGSAGGPETPAVPPVVSDDAPAPDDALASDGTPAPDSAPAQGGAPTQPLYGQYGQPGSGQGSFAQPAPGQDAYGQSQPGYGQPNQDAYGQSQPGNAQPGYGQQQHTQQQAPYGQQPPYQQQAPYGQQPYGTPNYGYPGAYQAPAQKPGKVMGIVGLVLSCLFFIPFASVAGLIISIVGLVQSRKAKERNGMALAGIIVGAVVTLFYVAATIALFAFAADAVYNVVEVCQEYGPGTHFVDGMTYECSVNSSGFEQSL